MSISSPIARRYRRRMWVLVALYAAAFLTAETLKIVDPDFGGPLAIALAVAVAAPIVGLIWSILSYAHDEPDEFLRAKYARAVTLGLGMTLIVCTLWGYLTRYAHAPALPVEYIVIVFGVFHGLANIIVDWSYR